MLVSVPQDDVISTKKIYTKTLKHKIQWNRSILISKSCYHTEEWSACVCLCLVDAGKAEMFFLRRPNVKRKKCIAKDLTFLRKFDG